MSRSVVLVGGGASVQDGIQLDLWNKIKHCEIWSLNFAFMAMPYLPKKQVWVDTTFFKSNMNKLQEISQKGVLCMVKKHPIYDAIPEILQFGVTRERFSLDEMKASNRVYIGSFGLSGFFALSLAVLYQYDTVYLLGYDFGTTSISNLNTHFYQNDKLGIVSKGIGNPGVYLQNNNTPKKEHRDFDYFKQFSNTKIYNVSLNSNIHSFDKISYNTFFELINENTSL